MSETRAKLDEWMVLSGRCQGIAVAILPTWLNGRGAMSGEAMENIEAVLKDASAALEEAVKALESTPTA